MVKNECYPRFMSSTWALLAYWVSHTQLSKASQPYVGRHSRPMVGYENGSKVHSEVIWLLTRKHVIATKLHKHVLFL